MSLVIKTILAGCIVASLSVQSFAQKLGLEQVIRAVCTNSDSVKLMKESVKRSDLLVKENWSAVYPRISASGTLAQSYGSAFGGSSSSSSGSSTQSAPLDKKQAGSAPPPSDTPLTYGMFQDYLGQMFGSIAEPQNTTIYSTGLQFSQTLYTFGKVGTALDVAKNINKSTHLTYKRNLQTIQLGALDAFYGTVLTDRAGAIEEHSLIRKKELYEFLDRNFKSGSGSKAQVLATKADVTSQTTKILAAKKDARSARMLLNAFMGSALTDSSKVDTLNIPTSLTSMVIPREDEAVANALHDRAELKSLKLAEEINRDGAKIYKAMYLPSIGAMGSVGYSKMKSGSALVSPDWQKSWTIGIGAQWMLFDGFASSSKAAMYTSDANKVEIAYNGVTKMIEIEVRSLIAECITADTNFSASQEAFAAADESYDLTNTNFKQGSGQFSDVQLAEDHLKQAEYGLISARYRQVKSRAALLIAMGKEIITLN